MRGKESRGSEGGGGEGVEERQGARLRGGWLRFWREIPLALSSGLRGAGARGAGEKGRKMYDF